MKSILKTLLIIFAAFFVTGCNSDNYAPNVLFISEDDLRPELGCYGNEIMQTPYLDKLVSKGSLFTNHFVQVPTCGASRQCLHCSL